MRKKVLVAILAGLLVAGVLYASNMAFKLNYTLLATGPGSVDGTSTIALPFNQQTNLLTASDLLNDIGGTAVVAQIERYDRTADGYVVYTGIGATPPFNLVPGDGYRVKLKPTAATRQYIIVGSDDPGMVVHFDGTGTNGSKSGTNLYAYPYHSIANDASELLNELGGTAIVAQVQRFDKSNNGRTSYTGIGATPPFALVPGEGYWVQLRTGVPSVDFIPSHY